MQKTLKLALVVMAVLFVCVAPAMAQDAASAAATARASNWAIGFGAGIGVGITILGAGYGISAIAGRAVESMARQPEVAGNIQGAMIVSAALIEGVSFFALIVCILILVLA